MLKDEVEMTNEEAAQHSSVIVLEIDDILRQIGISEAKWRSCIDQANVLIVRPVSEK
ncbi:hypothetical protein [Paenibacillus sp. LHD-38]|uniref:hypothetical protein n=1 Tax=Paenibacillus sp. LHD-38 TaxID=3072143 RepID=UPI00280FE15C|nr:hypothetical protein [Paenibacillus sp. LHD-38]MDQ8733023.1 hypothetical protein [Paenibacillus sp. LHD-38]